MLATRLSFNCVGLDTELFINTGAVDNKAEIECYQFFYNLIYLRRNSLILFSICGESRIVRQSEPVEKCRAKPRKVSSAFSE